MLTHVECPLCGATIEEIEVNVSGAHHPARWNESVGGWPASGPEIEVIGSIECPDGCALSPERIAVLESEAVERVNQELCDMADFDSDREYDDD